MRSLDNDRQNPDFFFSFHLEWNAQPGALTETRHGGAGRLGGRVSDVIEENTKSWKELKKKEKEGVFWRGKFARNQRVSVLQIDMIKEAVYNKVSVGRTGGAKHWSSWRDQRSTKSDPSSWLLFSFVPEVEQVQWLRSCWCLRRDSESARSAADVNK